MLMNVAQMLHDTCPAGNSPTSVLVLPEFTVGKNFFRNPGEPYNNESIPFGDLFDFECFEHHVWPCQVVLGLPRHGTCDKQLRQVPINKNWNFNWMLRLVYYALQPGKSIRMPFNAALQEVNRRAGPSWATTL